MKKIHYIFISIAIVIVVIIVNFVIGYLITPFNEVTYYFEKDGMHFYDNPCEDKYDCDKYICIPEILDNFGINKQQDCDMQQEEYYACMDKIEECTYQLKVRVYIGLFVLLFLSSFIGIILLIVYLTRRKKIEKQKRILWLLTSILLIFLPALIFIIYLTITFSFLFLFFSDRSF